MSQSENKLSSSYKMIYLYSFRPFANKTSQYSTYVEGPGNFWGREGYIFCQNFHKFARKLLCDKLPLWILCSCWYIILPSTMLPYTF